MWLLNTMHSSNAKYQMKATGFIKLFSGLMIGFIVYNMKMNCIWDANREGTCVWPRHISEKFPAGNYERKISCVRPVTCSSGFSCRGFIIVTILLRPKLQGKIPDNERNEIKTVQEKESKCWSCAIFANNVRYLIYEIGLEIFVETNCIDCYYTYWNEWFESNFRQSTTIVP